MTPFTNVALQTTLTDLLKARDEALELHRQARQLNEAAESTLGRFARHLMPRGARFVGDAKEATRDLDVSMWRLAFDLTGFRNLMDAQAVKEFEEELERKPLEFTEGNIRATFIELQGRADTMFKRGIVNVFRGLARQYKTNTREAFKVPRKLILTGVICDVLRTIRYGWASDQLNDLDRVFSVLDGRKFQPRELETAMGAAFSKSEVFENEYFMARAFKNGNVHLEILRDDLLEKVNEQIAEYYSDGALAHQKA